MKSIIFKKLTVKEKRHFRAGGLDPVPEGDACTFESDPNKPEIQCAGWLPEPDNPLCSTNPQNNEDPVG